jgi:hypothetical protein
MIDKHTFSATLDLLGKLSKRKAQMPMYEIKATQKIYLSKLIEAETQEEAQLLALSGLDVEDFGQAIDSDLILDGVQIVGFKNYKVEINFTTDRDLTPDELDNLEGHLVLQINEPTNEDNEDETYETKEITYKIEKTN